MIEAISVSFKYPDGKRALKNLNLMVNRGDFVFLVGPSGAGKSSIFKLLIKELTPTSGVLKVFGRNIAQYRGKQISMLRRNIGIIFQDFRLLEERTVYDNIEFAMRAGGCPVKEIKKKVPHLLKMVGLKEKANSQVIKLSGGEQQRVGMARAISNRPAMILADEPTGNLDPQTSVEIIDFLKNLNLKGTTVLIATHDQQVVDYFKKRVIYLENGEIVGDEARGAYQRVLL